MTCDCGRELTVCVSCAVEDYQSAHPDCQDCCTPASKVGRRGAQEEPKDCCDFCYEEGYRDGLADQSGSGVLQAVLDAIKGTLDPHSQIADHPNVKFAQMQMLALRGVGVEAGAHGGVGTPPCVTCEGRGWIDSNGAYRPGFYSGAMWVEPCPNCKPVGVGTPQEKDLERYDAAHERFQGSEIRALKQTVVALVRQLTAAHLVARVTPLDLAVDPIEVSRRYDPATGDELLWVPLGTLHQEEKA